MWMALKPKLNVSRVEDELLRLESTAEKAEAEYEKEIVMRKELEVTHAALTKERDELSSMVDSTKGGMSDFLDKQAKLQAQKAELEGQLNVSIDNHFGYRVS